MALKMQINKEGYQIRQAKYELTLNGAVIIARSRQQLVETKERNQKSAGIELNVNIRETKYTLISESERKRNLNHL